MKITIGGMGREAARLASFIGSVLTVMKVLKITAPTRMIRAIEVVLIAPERASLNLCPVNRLLTRV